MAFALVPSTKCFCILLYTFALGQGAKVYSNIFDPEAIAQIYRTAVKNNEAVILTFDKGLYSEDDRFANTGNEYNEAESYGNFQFPNLKTLLKSVHHKNYLEKVQKLKDNIFYKSGTLRTTNEDNVGEVRQKILNKLMGSRNEMKCKQNLKCHNNCTIEDDLNCKVKCDVVFKCDKENNDITKEEDCASDNECDDSNEPSNTVAPPYLKGSEESSDCDDE